MNTTHQGSGPKENRPEWYYTISKFEKSNISKAAAQLANTFIPYILLWIGMTWLVLSGAPYWIPLAMAIPAGGLLVRIFIIFHDCCHGSFFKSQKANRVLGFITSILTFTTFGEWRDSHLRHHATSGDLDRRGRGDVWMLTVKEYRQASPWKQLAYRIYRNPIVMFLIAPGIMFILLQRFTPKDAPKKVRHTVWLTNLEILAFGILFSYLFGFETYLMVQLPVILVAAWSGVWLFYVQHQYEGVHWAPHNKWDRLTASIKGSSYYKLPAVLNWFSGNIGLHHVHHLRPKIPNYNLTDCYNSVPELQEVKPLTIRESLKCVRLHLWDEATEKMIGIGDLEKTALPEGALNKIQRKAG